MLPDVSEHHSGSRSCHADTPRLHHGAHVGADPIVAQIDVLAISRQGLVLPHQKLSVEGDSAENNQECQAQEFGD